MIADEAIRSVAAKLQTTDLNVRREYLYFILRAGLLPAQKKDILPPVMETLKRSDLDFEKELKAFLPKSHWAIIRGFPGPLEREIERFL